MKKTPKKLLLNQDIFYVGQVTFKGIIQKQMFNPFSVGTICGIQNLTSKDVKSVHVVKELKSYNARRPVT